MLKTEKLQKIKDEALKNYVPILKDDSLEYIEKILEERKPNSILEVGTAVGYSAICFSEYLEGENPKIVTIEIDEATYNVAQKNVQEMEKQDVITLINADAYEYMKTLEDKFDVVFIDAAKGQYMHYLEQALRLTKPGSIIIADNVLFKGMVLGGYNEHKHRTAVTRLREYISAIDENENLESCVKDIGDGVAVSIVK